MNWFERLAGLTPNAVPAFGMMTPQHMVEHLEWAILGTLSDPPSPVLTPEDKLPSLKRFLMSSHPLQQGFKMPLLPKEELVPLKYADLASAIAGLQATWERSTTFWESNPDFMSQHPIFGPLNFDEWMQFNRKHFEHHLSQFNL